MSAAYSNEQAEYCTMLAVLSWGRAYGERAKSGAVLNVAAVEQGTWLHERSGVAG